MADDWPLVHLDELAGVREKKMLPSRGDSRPYIGLEHIAQGRPKLIGTGRAGEVVSHKTVFKAGDILFGKLRPALRKVVRPGFDGVCSTDILAIYPKEQGDGPYLQQLLHSDRLLTHALQSAEGTKMPRTSWADLRSYMFRCPPRYERARIGGILAAIDDAINKTETVIEAAERLRKALAQELLTRGIPGRHSEWKQVPGIGTVPACWDIAKLGRVAEIQTGVAKNAKANRADPVELPYLRVANVQDGFLDLSELKTIAVERRDWRRFELRVGDVLFTEGGDFDKLGRGAVWQGLIEPCLHQNHVFAVRAVRERLLSEYLTLYAASPAAKRYFLKASKQTTNLASINATQLRNFPVVLPLVDEQRAIVEALAAHATRTAAERAHAAQLQAIKAALASALLTGLLRVGTSGKDAEE